MTAADHLLTYRAELRELGGNLPFHAEVRGAFDNRAAESPPWVMIAADGEPGRPFRVERAKLQADGTPAWVEGVRQEGGAFDVSVRGVSSALTRAQYQLAGSLVDLLLIFCNTPGGRKADPRSENVRELAEAMRAVAKQEEIPLERVTWAAMAQEMVLDEDTIYYRRKLAVESVPEITKAEVIAAARNLQDSSGDIAARQ